MKADYRLYLVTEESLPAEELLHTVEQAVKGGVTIVQLREKRSEGRVLFEKAARLKALLDRYGVPLIINDRVDIALAVGAAGVHIGQQDVPLAAVRGIVPPSMIVGVSVRAVQNARQAEQGGADYIGVGAVYPTRSKDDAEMLPDGALETIVQAVSIPAVAIGGIQLDNVGTLKNSGVKGIAVVSAIMKAENPYCAAKALRKAWLRSNVSSVQP